MNYFEYDRDFKTREITELMPYLKLQPDWEIAVIPPFAGASVRFCIKKGNAEVSVYADFFRNIGNSNKPYWEVYPYHYDVFRCYINNTDELLEAIKQSIKEQENE